MKNYHHVKTIFRFILLCYFVIFVPAFKNDVSILNPSIAPSSGFCMQDLLGNSSAGIFQNKMTKSLFYTQDGTNLTQIQQFSGISFKEIKCFSKERIILLALNSSIYEYNFTSNTKTSFDSPLAKLINLVEIQNQKNKLIYVKNDSIRIKQFPLNPLSKETSYTLNATVQYLKCSFNRNNSLDRYCFLMLSNFSSLMYFHISEPQKLYQRPMKGIKFFTFSQIFERIYVGFQNGQIRQYSIFEKGVLIFQRYTKVSLGKSIVNLAVNQIRGEILYLNEAYEIGVISIDSGQQIGFTTQAQKFCDFETKLYLLSRNSIAVFNPNKLMSTIKLLDTETVILNSINNSTQTGKFTTLCQEKLQFFDLSSSQCKACARSCSICDQQTGQCIKCHSGYFLNNKECLNCKYASIVSDYYSLCFQQNQLAVLSYTNILTPALASTIHVTYSLLSGSALLFVFLRFINFWSIISLYYFLNIEQIPFFLLEILQKIFTLLNGSVFEFFNIDISDMNLGIEQKNINEKMTATKITTDFVAANFQSFIMYGYSIFLICILYDGIKRWLKKFQIHIFENVKLEACLEQFVGLFITLLVPSYLFIEEPNFSSFLQKLNSSFFILLLAIGLLFPFLFTIMTLERITMKKRISMMKKSLRRKGLISQSIFSQAKITSSKNNKTKNNKIKSQKRLVNILSQEQTQKFLYCLNCFWSPFLVGFRSPLYFLVFGFMNHSLAFWNSFYAKQWKANSILGKFIFWVYHLCFVLMKIFPRYFFSFALMAFCFIIVGGIHQLLSALGEKLYFLILVLKNKKKNNKIGIQPKNKEKQITSEQFSHYKQQHSNKLPRQSLSQNYRKSSLKNIDTTKTSFAESTKRIIKRVKIAQKKQVLFKNSINEEFNNGCEQNNEKSLQKIQLSRKNIQQKDFLNQRKVKFQNVQNFIQKSYQSKKIEVQTRQTKNNQNKIKKPEDLQNFKLKKLSKNERRALFDHQFDHSDFHQQKLVNQNKISKLNQNNPILATFSHPQRPQIKKLKFLKINSTQKKFEQFSKTSNQL